jgi:hypothetical protein
MSVIRLASGALFVHSPVALDAALRAELEPLGRPRYAVAPNRFHHLWAAQWPAAWPGLELWLAPGLAEKCPDLEPAGVLGDDAAPGWSGELDQLFFRGFAIANEVVFCHRASRTLLLTDLALNIGADAGLLTRVVMRLAGSYPRFGPTLLEKLMMKRPAARASLEKILAWDFDRVIVSHGDVLEADGVRVLRDAYSWLLG